MWRRATRHRYWRQYGLAPTLALVAAIPLGGCQLFFRQSLTVHRTCASSTTCVVTLKSGADTTDALRWTMTSANPRVVFVPDHGEIAPGATVPVAITLPTGVCPIEVAGATMLRSNTVGSWSDQLVQRDPQTGACRAAPESVP